VTEESGSVGDTQVGRERRREEKCLKQVEHLEQSKEESEKAAAVVGAGTSSLSAGVVGAGFIESNRLRDEFRVDREVREEISGVLARTSRGPGCKTPNRSAWVAEKGSAGDASSIHRITVVINMHLMSGQHLNAKNTGKRQEVNAGRDTPNDPPEVYR
jgi:hypothetical protein